MIKASTESQVLEQLKLCKDFKLHGQPVEIINIESFQLFTIKRGSFKDGNILFEGIIEVNEKAPDGSCFRFYDLTGTAIETDNEVTIVLPVQLKNSCY